mmetsp:Transcript_37096/g.104699  ORF Transcript_37096/g.104699 Transcript_37096/m.104699 type:complete len:244 (-) Transcript_37096:945-1676(-)
MAKISVSATIVFCPPLSCCIVWTSPMPNDMRTFTPLYFSCASSAMSSSASSAASSEGLPATRFCMTSSPRPPGASSAKISRKCFATPLKVRSMASSLRMSSARTSSLIFTSPACSSACRLRRSSRCSVNVTYCSSAFLLTWLNCLSSSPTFLRRRWRSFVPLFLYFSKASDGRLPSSRIFFDTSSCRWLYCVRRDSSVSSLRSCSLALSSRASLAASCCSSSFLSSWVCCLSWSVFPLICPSV